MTDIEIKTLKLMKLMKSMNDTLEKINQKMDKVTFNVPDFSDSDPGSDYDSDQEESTTKIKPEELEEAFKRSFKSLVSNNTHNLSHDIYDGIEDIFCYMDKHFINPKTADLSFFMEDKKLSIAEYNINLENTINHIFSEIPYFLKPKLNKLREILLEKYINKDEIKRVEKFRKDGEFIGKAIVD